MQKKYMASLSRLIQNEDVELSKLNSRRLVFYLAGMFMVIASIAESLEPTRPTWVIAALGIIGSYFLCIGIYIRSSLKIWPVLKGYLDKERIVSDSENT